MTQSFQTGRYWNVERTSSKPTAPLVFLSAVKRPTESLDFILGIEIVNRGADDLRQPAAAEVELGRRLARDRDADVGGAQAGLDVVRLLALLGEGDDAGTHAAEVLDLDARQLRQARTQPIG